jgi:hypothetical protein
MTLRRPRFGSFFAAMLLRVNDGHAQPADERQEEAYNELVSSGFLAKKASGDYTITAQGLQVVDEVHAQRRSAHPDEKG